MESLLDIPLISVSHIRSAGYLLENLAFRNLARLVPGDWEDFEKTDPKLIPLIQRELRSLYERDSANIRKGVYPIQVLRPESPVAHLKRIPKLLLDGYRIGMKRKAGRTTQFTPRAEELLEGLPRYYRRNFHFQTDGYLSESSAELYDHQVELLFGGAANAMRRLIIPGLKKAFGARSEGKGLTFLEVAAGTGTTTQFVRQAFPKAKIVVTDLSDPYLKHARSRLSRYDGLDFLQANAADLPFQGERFDAVYSVFLYHELPMSERKAVIAEAKRVVKPGGFIGLVDSLQKGDKPELDSALLQFPKDFHEPFYRNYIEHPMEDLLRAEGLERIHADTGFFSKVCWGFRPC